jgi:pimeloyl-ACP methyl ester carboxylesterase
MLAVGVSAALAGPASANHRGGHGAQKAAKVGFAADFPRLTDTEWGWPLGGFGGIKAGAARQHVPVIFVHGNNTDHGDWYPVRDDFRAAGWTDQELFALSYNGLGGPNGEAAGRRNPEADTERAALGYDGSSRITGNDVNVPDLYNFIHAVQSYTGSKRFTLVSHSLGVTVARQTLKIHPELRADLVAFVGIAGGNHGTSFCPPGSEANLMSCDEIAAGTAWLAVLNGPGDPAFYGPTYAQSPLLRGADNRQFPGTYHNDLRIDAAIVSVYRAFIEQTEAALSTAPATITRAQATTAASAQAAEAGDPIAASGPAMPVALGLAIVAAAVASRAVSRRGRALPQR